MHEIILHRLQRDGLAIVLRNLEPAILVAVELANLLDLRAILQFLVSRGLIEGVAVQLLPDVVVRLPILLLADMIRYLFGDVVPVGNVVRGVDGLGELEILPQGLIHIFVLVEQIFL